MTQMHNGLVCPTPPSARRKSLVQHTLLREYSKPGPQFYPSRALFHPFPCANQSVAFARGSSDGQSYITAQRRLSYHGLG
ncbi:hypothetical protein Mapa_000727 [Marchantia paleacea]|nr:hypothetical protein Mapa_000727 [Marchantia paleacea]